MVDLNIINVKVFNTQMLHLYGYSAWKLVIHECSAAHHLIHTQVHLKIFNDRIRILQ